jgi:NADH-quinone oxidoreductase subunit J
MDPQIIHAVLFWIVAVLTGVCAISVVVTQNIVRSATWLLFTLAGTSATFFLLGADFVGATQLLVYVGGTLVLVVFGVMLTAQGPFVNLKAGAAEWAFTAVVGLLLLGVLSLTIYSVKIPNQRFRITDEALENLKADGVPESVLAKADPVKDAVFENETDLVEHFEKALTPQGFAPHKAAFLKNTQWNDRPSDLVTNPTRSLNSAALGQSFLGMREATPEARLTGMPNPNDAPRRTQIAYFLPFEIISIHLLVVLIGAAYLARAKRRRGAAPL